MFCSRCGTEVDDQAKFCPSCGLDLGTTTAGAHVQAERSEASEQDLVREALKDEWEIERELGRGGMAIVFRARDRQLDRDVAIKVLPFSLAFDKEFVERFQREARTAARLEHPFIIPIYRVGHSGRVIYFVMKYLRGGSLSDRLEMGRQAAPDIRRLLTETAKALGYAHKHGIVHRDIKPDNIMFDEAGHAVVTDFGIAKAATGTRLTGTGMSIGTPHYMSPEQARAGTLDGRSDIYSLGVVAYQCLAGQVPFDGEDAFAIGYKHVTEEPPTPELRTPEERQLYQIILRMVAKAPEERFQTADDLVAMLEGRPSAQAATIRVSSADAPTALIPTPAGTRPSMTAAARESTPTTPIPTAQHRTEPPVRKKRGGVLVGLLLFVFMGAGGAGGYWYFALDHRWPLAAGGGEAGRLGGPASDSSQVTVGAGDTASAATADTAPAAAALTPAPVVRDTTLSPSAPPVTNLPNTGKIVLSGVPRLAAIVTVDGRRVQGDTVAVDAGTRHVEVRREGYEPFAKTVRVPRGETVLVQVVLTAARPAAPPASRADCADPASENYNLGGACFDSRPSVSEACVVQGPAGGQAVLAVKVLANGTVDSIRPMRRSLINIPAIRFARNARYTPAMKQGQPVTAWMRLPCRAR